MWLNYLTKLTAPRVIGLIIMVNLTAFLYTYNSKLYIVKTQKGDITDAVDRPMKYILQWTGRLSPPFWVMGVRNSAFVKNKCVYSNCFVTDNRNYFKNLSDFDALAFNGWDVINLWPHQLPQIRSPKQKYIFAAMESSDNYPACDKILDGFFNWTWTYKLDSNFRWGYMTIYDLEGSIVGPAINMKWSNELKPIAEDLKVKLSSKSKTAAWFVSHCWTKGRREDFVGELQKELQPYELSVDIYGECGSLYCPDDDNNAVCFKLVENEYHFYFSFENSLCEDYVTEKLLTALNNYAVPVVYGGANYSRFLPPGSYLDARELGAKELARQMNEIMNNKSMYYDFFRWRNHYVYKETSSEEDICKLCEMMNDEEQVSKVTVWNDFRTWWNGAQYKNNC